MKQNELHKMPPKKVKRKIFLKQFFARQIEHRTNETKN